MMTIPESTASQGFVCDIHFERTGSIRDRVVDCTREEMIDLVFDILGKLEKIQIESENFNRHLEEVLGYNEPMSG